MIAFGKTISLFLIEGDPNKRWVCELSNWNGKAYKIPRMDVKLCSDRPDLCGCGVYFLFGKSDDMQKDIIYIGEAENVYDRLKQHVQPSGKDFWNECVAFISKDNRLNKAHIKYLEHRCYELAKETGRYLIDNSSVPASASLTEAEQAEMEEYLYNVRLITNALGHKVFEPLVLSEPTSQTQNVQPILSISAARGAQASGQRTNDGFVVLKGSRVANPATALCPPWVCTLRERLVESGVIDRYWIFTENWLFSSPSTAASVVMGRKANGLLEWRTDDHITLGSIEESIV